MFFVLSAVVVALVIGGAACSQSSQTLAVAGKQAIAYYTCPMHPTVKADKPGACPICGMTLQPVYGGAAGVTNATPSTTNSQTAQDAKPYPLETCVVDGMKLGSMGDPYVFVYQGQEIKLCCENCKPEFLGDPAKYMKKIQDAETAK